MAFSFVLPQEFFDHLYQEKEFCEEIGRVILSASRLETNLRRYLKAKGVKNVRSKSTLGVLVEKLKENKMLSSNGCMHFDDLVLKRNYLAHNLYDLFTAEIEETILPRTELTKSDVHMFVERAHVLADDFLYFAQFVTKADTQKKYLL